jgi:serine/threonine-protein kinase
MRPSAPSTLVTAEAARLRGMTPQQLRRRLRGDLDTIVLQAVRREPEQRYSSAETLVADLERHGAGQPISARPATLSYRVRKLARRRPWLLPTAAAALVAVSGYVATLARYTRQLEQERNLARVEAERAAQVQEFLVGVFRSADPYARADPDRGRAVTVLEATEMGVERARSELSDRPDLQGALLAAVADVYSNLDLREPAREMREEALDLQRAAHGERSAEVARGLRKMGSLLALEGQVDSAEVLLVRSLELTRALHGPLDTAVAGVLTDLARLSQWRGHLDEAEEQLVTAIEILRRHDPLPAAHLAAAYASLLDIYPMSQRLQEARAAGEEAVRLSRLAYGQDHPRTALALVELADLHDWEGHPERAVPRYREAIRILDASLGPEHERTLQARNNLAVTLRNLGDLVGAEEVHSRVLTAWRTKREKPDWRLGDALQNMAIVLQEQGRLDEAIPLLLEARETYDAVLAPTHYRRAYPRLALAAVRIERGEFESAERFARESADILDSAFAEPNYLTAMADCRLGRALAGKGNLTAARGLLEPSVETLAGTNQPSPRYEVECRRALAAVYRKLGREDLAESHLAVARTLEGSEADDPTN